MIKRYICMLIVAVVFLPHSNIYAQGDANRLEVFQTIEIEKGTTDLQFPIVLTNETGIVGFQCDLYLPEGFTVTTNVYDNNYLIDVIRTTTTNHSLATHKMSDGTLRIVVSSMTNAVFSGNSGTILNVMLDVGENADVGNHTIILKNIVLTDSEANRYTSADVSCVIVIKEPEQPVTVTADNLTMAYGDEVPDFTYTSEGAELDGVPSFSCEATSTSPVGTYPIVVTNGTIVNNLVTYVNGTLTITSAPLIISVGNYTKKQYDKVPEFEISYSGFKNEETEDVLTKLPVLSCEANENSLPGEYPIYLSGAEAENYNIQYVAGKLIVTEPDSYNLIYMLDGEEYQRFTIKYKDIITPLAEIKMEGYTFSGWGDIPETMPAHDVIVNGSFTINSYSLVYKLDGEVYKTLSIVYGTELIAESAPTREGYTFSGWSEIPATMPASDVEVTGSFTINSYTLTYKVDGEEYKTLTVVYGTALIAEDALTREGYTFSGWSEIPATMPANDVEVTGTFIVNKYKVTFIYGNEVLKIIEVEFGTEIPLPESLESDGYTLIEWLEVPETMPANDIYIYASYTDGIKAIANESDCKVYDIKGNCLSKPQHGINIIRMKDGTTRKVLIK